MLNKVVWCSGPVYDALYLNDAKVCVSEEISMSELQSIVGDRPFTLEHRYVDEEWKRRTVWPINLKHVKEREL